MKQRPTYKRLVPISVGIILLLVASGCQEPFIDIGDPDKAKTISPDDQVVQKILQVVYLDGSHDNFIDGCSETTLLFPYTVSIEEQLFEIREKADIDTLIFDHFFNRGDIEILFPVTVSLSDYTQLTLTDEDDLEELQELFNEDLVDNDNECIDFIYPIKIATYNSTTQRTDLLTIQDDREMFNLFDEVSGLTLEIDFPIELRPHTGEAISISDNLNLKDQIDAYEDQCDEQDRVEFNDQDYPLLELMSNGDWIVEWYSDTTNETDAFSGYHFDFRNDLLVRVDNGSAVQQGAWEPDFYDDSIYIEIDFDSDQAPLVWLNHEWHVIQIDRYHIELETESDYDGYIKTLHLGRRD